MPPSLSKELASWARAIFALHALFLPMSLVKAEEAQFVGSLVCKECHGGPFGDWRSSHHAAAMQKSGEWSVLGKFDGSVFKTENSETVFFKRNDKYWVRTDGADGRRADFEISHTIGVFPLQQYLITLSGGRLQAFGVAWDARAAEQGGQRWFDLYAGREFRAGAAMHWTGAEQNANYQCVWCHTINLKKNFDFRTATFETGWSEAGVGCEACHGPASTHLTWAREGRRESAERGFSVVLDARKEAFWTIDQNGKPHQGAPRARDAEIEICAGCHARRQQFSQSGRFFDAFRPVTLEAGLYYPDGQQRDEVYNYASFLQSRMYAAGVTCSDCHNSHSGKIRAPGNAVCVQCHPSGRFDQIAHHHHPAGSAGAQCVNCHMPTTTYMGVHARHDHSIRIPRPDRSLTIETPNACNQCHTDKSPSWAAARVKEWYPTALPGAQTFAEAFANAELDGVGARAELARIAEDPAQAPIVRASALQRLASKSAREGWAPAQRLLADRDPNIRAAAVAALVETEPNMRAAYLSRALKDETRLVRIDAARAIAGEAEQELTPEDRKAFEQAIAEYEAAQLFNAERAESHVNLGSLYRARGDVLAARRAFESALALDRDFTPAAIALAELQRVGGDEAAAEAALRKAIEGNPRSGEAFYALGLSLVRQKRLDEAIKSLGDAVQHSPGESRFAYVYAVALHDAGKVAQAIEALRAAISKHPNDREILFALAEYEMESGDFISAQGRARRLVELEPSSADIQQFARRLLSK